MTEGNGLGDGSRGWRWLKGMEVAQEDGGGPGGWRWWPGGWRRPRRMEVAQEDGGGPRGWRWFKGDGGREVFIAERRGC